jgi:fatty acid desaturase
VFKYPSDRLPVALIVCLSIFDFVAYLVVDSFWVLLGLWLLLAIPNGVISAWNHHHQHVHTFRSNALNRMYEVLLAFHSGITSNLWVLHHNLGHHMHFLDQSKDESAWQRKDGTTMGVVEYSFSIASTAYYRGYQVGKKHPKHQRVFLLGTAFTFALLVVLIAARPLQALFLYVLPMITSLLFTAWVTYDHHSGLDTESPLEASYNIMNPTFNLLTGNLGYHTAHHHRMGVHWSKLPELHATLVEQIPAHLYRKSTFDVFFPSNREARSNRAFPSNHRAAVDTSPVSQGQFLTEAQGISPAE